MPRLSLSQFSLTVQNYGLRHHSFHFISINFIFNLEVHQNDYKIWYSLTKIWQEDFSFSLSLSFFFFFFFYKIVFETNLLLPASQPWLSKESFDINEQLLVHSWSQRFRDVGDTSCLISIDFRPFFYLLIYQRNFWWKLFLL